MDRRRALVVAGTLTASLAMAGTAMAVNLGLLGSDSDPVGDLTPTAVQPAAQRETASTVPTHTRPRVRVIVQDVPVAVGPSGGTSSATGAVESTPAPAPAPAPAPTPSYDDDDDHGDDGTYDEDEDEDEDHGDDHADEDEDEGEDDD